MIDTSLLLGLVLIAAGLFLGAAAFLVLTRRGEAEAPEPEPESPQPSEGDEPPSSPEPEPVPPPPPPPPPPSPAPPPPPEPSSGEAPMPEPTQEASPPPEMDRRLFPVVTLMRDDATGDLVLQVGAHTYRTVAELKGSADWNRVDYASRDLARWLEETPAPPRKAEERLKEPVPPGGSMVDQINQILEEKLSGSPTAARAVRLVEGPGGAVRVFIGVQGYAVDEVPDPAVRTLIREAVAEWEAKQ